MLSTQLYSVKIHALAHTYAHVYCNLCLMGLVNFGPRKWVPGIIMHPRDRQYRSPSAAMTCTAPYALCLSMPLYNLSKSFFAKLNHVEDARKITKYVRTCIYLYSSHNIIISLVTDLRVVVLQHTRAYIILMCHNIRTYVIL